MYNKKRGEEVEVEAWKKRPRHGGVGSRRDPHLFTVLRRDEFEFWYGIHGPDGDHRRYAVDLDTAYRFLRRQVLKLECLFERLNKLPPDVHINDIEEFVNEALSGSGRPGGAESLGKSAQLELDLDDDRSPATPRSVLV